MVSTKFSDQPINIEENGNKLDEKVEKLEIDIKSDSSSATSQHCSSDQKGVTGMKYQSNMANENSASHLLDTAL